MFDVNNPLAGVALMFGAMLSYIVLIGGVPAVLRFPARSPATHAFTFTVTCHCAVGFTVQVYVPPNPLIVPFPIFTSHAMKLYIASLNNAVAVNVVFVHAPTADVNATVGDVVSIFIALFAHSDHAAHGTNNVNIPLFPTLSLIVHQFKISALVLR